MRSRDGLSLFLCGFVPALVLAACSSDGSGKARAGSGGDSGDDGREDAGSGGGSAAGGGASAGGGTGAGGGGTGAGGTGTGTGGSTGAGAGGAPVDAGVPDCTLGADWTVVDDYAYPDATNTNPSSLFALGSTVRATSLAVASGVATGILRSGDGKDFALVKAEVGLGGDVLALSSGTLFTTGNIGSDRVVRRSTDAGETWETVDTVAFADGACTPGALAATSGGTLYWGASCDVQGWQVRKSENGGDAWEDVGGPFQLADAMPARFASILVDDADQVYVSGNAQDADQVAHWVVRGLGSNDTFVTLDDFVLEPGKSGLNPILHGGKRLYAVGAADATDGRHWIVRRSVAGGSGWQTIDDFVAVDSSDRVATAAHEARDGTLVVAGTVTVASVTSVLVRRSTDDGQTWEAEAPYSYADGKPSGSVGPLVSDRWGNVYAAVRGVGSDDHAHALVRRLACTP